MRGTAVACKFYGRGHCAQDLCLLQAKIKLDSTEVLPFCPNMSASAVQVQFRVSKRQVTLPCSFLNTLRGRRQVSHHPPIAARPCGE